MSEPIPVTLVTGFLGAGKTTFLNYLLSTEHGARLAVIVNEFDELGIDRDLIQNTRGQLVEMNNGCLCCTVQGDLKPLIVSLLEEDRGLTGIVIETTGLANPGPIASAFFADPILCEATRLDAIVTLVDAVNIRRHLDLAHPDADSLPYAQIAYADRILLNKIDRLPESELAELERALRSLNPLAQVRRTAYGVLPVAEILNLQAFSFEGRFDPHGGHDHGHDQAIGSVSFTTEQEFDQVKLNTYFCNLLRDQGDRLYRCKGIVNVSQLDEPLLFQGVSSLFATSPGKPWSPGQPRQTRAVFIGRELDRAALEAGFLGCRVSP